MKVASSPLGQAANSRESGFQRAGAEPAAPLTAEANIRAHNQELMERTHDLLDLPILILTEQRDEALRQLATAEELAEARRLTLIAEQDNFVSFLMSEHEQKLAELQQALDSSRQELSRARSLYRPEIPPEGTSVQPTATVTQEIEALRRALDAATAEVDETRLDARRLQEERDEAIRAIDEARIELMGEVESARDDCFQLETRLDEAHRLLEDAHDQTRDEAERFSEELSELRRELSERNEEVRRLRARLATHVTESKASRPPPPAAEQELEQARKEAHQLRQQLIATKRELARVAPGLDPRNAASRIPRASATLPTQATAPETRRFDAKLTTGPRPTPLGVTGPGTKRG